MIYKYLIKSKDKVIGIDENGQEIALDSLDIEHYGFSLRRLQEYIESSTPIDFIYSNYPLLFGTGDKFLEGEILAMLDENKQSTPIAAYTGIPKHQLVLPKSDIRLRMLDEVKEFTLYSETVNQGIIRVVFSVDYGSTWLTYKNNEFVELNISNLDEVKEQGLTPDQFNSIKTKWNEIITEDHIRFGYYLEITSQEDVAKVDKLEALFKMMGRWKKVKESDYDYEYDNTNIYISIYKDGSYKINYQE